MQSIDNEVQLEHIPFEEYAVLQRESIGRDAWIRHGDTMTWGRGGAGLLIVSTDDVLLLKRSEDVADPCVWGIPGGARRETGSGLEDALVTAITESREEMCGLPRGRIRKQPYTYQRPGTDFTYCTFVLEIDQAERQTFIPELNWEHTDYGWFGSKRLQNIEIHPGVMDVLKKCNYFVPQPIKL